MEFVERQPNFSNVKAVLQNEQPDRPVLFDFIIDDEFLKKHPDANFVPRTVPGSLQYHVERHNALMKLGYDFYPLTACDFHFTYRDVRSEKTRSLNDGFVITDEDSYARYKWPEPENCDYSVLQKLNMYLFDGVKLVVFNTESVFGGAVRLAGFENLCFMLYDNSKLFSALVDDVGRRVLRYNEICAAESNVGAVVVNDDWGFKTQLMFPREVMWEYFFPWHKRIVEAIHNQGKCAILHSCGNIYPVMDDVIHEIGYDAKHSFEDVISPIEDVMVEWGESIALLGGVDIDYLCKHSPEEIKVRAMNLVRKGMESGGYALGSGNSIPAYIPIENYQAMADAVLGWR